MRRCPWLVVIGAFVLAGCSSTSDSLQSSRAGKCTDELLRGVDPQDFGASRATVRHYISLTYCDRFARKGWVYADGALTIAAQRWLVRGGRCGTSTPGGTTKTVPCESLRVPGEPIECAMLRHVRRSEVRTYISKLRARGPVRCDDGTPLAELGVP